MHSNRVPIILWLVCGCAASAPVAEPSAHGARAGRTPPIELDADDCDNTIEGRLFSRSGALWFDTRPDGENAPTDSWEEPPGLPDDAEAWSALGWEAGETLVTTVPGTFSALLPGVWPERALAVRSFYAGWGRNAGQEGDDALGSLDILTLEFQPLWTPGGRVHLVGKVGERALVLFEDADGERMAALDRAGNVTARSEPIETPMWMVRTEQAQVGLPWIAPLDAAGLLLLCGETKICIARVGETEIAIERTETAAEGLGWSPTAGPLVELPEEQCLTLGPDPATWSAAQPGPCPEDRVSRYAEEPALPVDGVPTSGVRGLATKCLVRSELLLPRLRDPSRPRSAEYDDYVIAGAGVVVLNDHDWDQEGLDLDLLVRGDRLAVAFTRLSTLGAGTVRRGFGVALPPGSVEARPITVGGRAMYRVKIHTNVPFPFLVPGDCWQGRLVVRVVGPFINEGELAFANRNWEFGTCE